MADERDQLDALMAQIAQDAGAKLHVWPWPGRAVRHIILRDTHDNGGSQLEIAQIEDDGTVRVLGHDRGPEVTEFFGTGITSYDWQYVIPPERVGNLLTALGGQESNDVLAAFGTYYDQHHGHVHDLLTSPEVAASFSIWHSQDAEGRAMCADEDHAAASRRARRSASPGCFQARPNSRTKPVVDGTSICTPGDDQRWCLCLLHRFIGAMPDRPDRRRPMSNKARRTCDHHDG